MIFIGDQQGSILFTNESVTRKLGFDKEELKDMHILDVHPPDLRLKAEQIFSEMFAGERESCPLPLQGKDGRLVPVETRVWFGQWNGKDCIFGLSKDLTKEQEALQKFDKLFQSNPALMAVSVLPERRFTEVNQAFLDVLGFTRAEVIGKTAEDLGLFLDQGKQNTVSVQLQEQGFAQGIELKVRCQNGRILDGLFSGEAIESQGQQLFLTVMTDITDRKEAEKALAESENPLPGTGGVYGRRNLPFGRKRAPRLLQLRSGNHYRI